MLQKGKNLSEKGRMSRSTLAAGAVAADVAILATALLVAYALRFNFAIPDVHINLLRSVFPTVIAVEIASLLLFGCYRIVWRYFSASDVVRFFASFASTACFFLGLRFLLPLTLSHFYPPISVTLINAVVAFCAVLLVRFARRFAEESRSQRHRNRVRVLVVGAGEGGNALAYALRHERDATREVVGFLDDSPDRLGAVIQGVAVLGTIDDAARVISSVGADEVIVTIGKLSRIKLQPLFAAAENAGAKLLIAPDYSRVLDGIAGSGSLREAEIADILRRPEIAIEDIAVHRSFLGGKRVMVTGAGGSIGSEISRQVLAAGAAKLILVERSENAMFNVHRSLLARKPADGVVIPCVADIADEERMRHIFRKYQPEIVIHAAAHKHVPMMECNVCEAVGNNVFATELLGRLSCESGVDRFILLSTDKAVKPSSVMGATKRVCEVLLQNLNGKAVTRFSAVRFGNVLGASGSVVPIFREQIQNGGPVTVTHPDMTRYFMTIPEAVHLTLEAASLAHGGEIFILDMGEPVKIVELAEDMIRLSGHIPNDDIPITFVGVRPGEKMAEELASPSEKVEPTAHPQISCGRMIAMPDTFVSELKSRLSASTKDGDDSVAREMLMELVGKCD